MEMPKKRYFVLAVWEESRDISGARPLRFQLEDPRSGKQWIFSEGHLVQKKIQALIKKEEK